MKSLSKIVVVLIGCFSILTIHQAFAEDEAVQEIQKPEIDEASRANPIVLKGIKQAGDIKEALNDYVKKNFKDYEISVYMYTMHGERFIEILSIQNEEGKEKLIYFDMTDVYKKLTPKGRAARKVVDSLEDKHNPLPNPKKEQ